MLRQIQLNHQMAVNNLTFLLIIFSILNQISFQVTTAASIPSESLVNGESSLQSPSKSNINSIESTYPDQTDFDSFLNQLFMVPQVSTPQQLQYQQQQLQQQQQFPSATGDNLFNDGLKYFSTSRGKRSGISDQRLMELETLLALAKKFEEKQPTHKVAFGLFDPDKIGRRRRRRSLVSF